jgi:uncharacterized protein YjdB
MRRTLLLVALLPAVLLTWGCSSDPATIDIEPKRALLKSKDDSVQLKVTIKNKDGKVLTNVPVRYKSLTPTMAFVDATGNVRAVTSGMAAVLVEAGDIAAQAEVLIQIPKKIVIEPTSPLMMMGVTRGFKGTVYDDRNKPLIAGEIRWSSSDTNIFTVDDRGNVKTINEGTATLKAFAAGIEGSTEITVKHEDLTEIEEPPE